MPQESQGAIISKKQITDLESDYYDERDIARSLERTNIGKNQLKLVSFNGLSPKAISESSYLLYLLY